MIIEHTYDNKYYGKGIILIDTVLFTRTLYRYDGYGGKVVKPTITKEKLNTQTIYSWATNSRAKIKLWKEFNRKSPNEERKYKHVYYL